MITFELMMTIIIFYFVMYVTPGPNNSILTASGIKFGFKRTIPNIFGIATGHGIQLALVCFGLGGLFVQFPFLLDILKYIGATYLLYLAWRIFGSLNTRSIEDKSSPLKYYEAILFQFVNPKAWVICITAVSLFFPKDEHVVIGTILMVFMSTVINIPSISIWALGGSVIKKYLDKIILKKIVEWLLAVLLFLTALTIIIPKETVSHFVDTLIIKK